MAMTMTEKILAAHAGKQQVRPGEILEVGVDLLMLNEGTASLAIPQFESIGVPTVWDRQRVALVNSHFTPARDAMAASFSRTMRAFAHKHAIEHFFEVGRSGIEHALLPEQGLVAPGMVIIGADSHSTTYGALGCFATGVGSTDAAGVLATGRIWLKVPATRRLLVAGRPADPWVCAKDLVLYALGQIGDDGASYQALEWTGPAVAELSVEGRLTLCNMAIEAGAKSGIVAPDGTTAAYLAGRSRFASTCYASDPDAAVAASHEWDATDLEPQVACPYSPSNVHPLSRVAGVRLDQVYIGSCTNGRIEDLRIAAAVLRGRRVHRDTRLIVVPATSEVHAQATREGLVEVFLAAGAAVSTPTCGACLGGHMGVLAEGEVCLSTTNRNYVGRMGHPGSQVYLSSPAVAAASAVAGCIAHPGTVVRPGEVLA